MRRPAVLCLAVLVCFLCLAARTPDEQELWDHYVGRIVTAKIDLPYFVVINDGQLDTIDYRRALNPERAGSVVLGGIALAKGDSNVIASVTIKKKYIRFHLGKTGKKQVLEAFTEPLPNEAAGRDDAPSPVTITLLYGATIGKRGAQFRTAREVVRDDIDIQAINTQLAAVLDTRSLMSIEEVPALFRAAVEAGRAELGMDKKALFLAMGEPAQKKMDIEGEDVVEQWVYESDSLETTVVEITNGSVTSVRHF